MEINDKISKLNQLISNISNHSIEDPVDYSLDLINDLSFDSLLLIEFVVKVEETFNIQIDDDYLLLNYLRSYKWWVDYILSY